MGTTRDVPFSHLFPGNYSQNVESYHPSYSIFLFLSRAVSVNIYSVAFFNCVVKLSIIFHNTDNKVVK